jgi:hypothetical protein
VRRLAPPPLRSEACAAHYFLPRATMSLVQFLLVQLIAIAVLAVLQIRYGL